MNKFNLIIIIKRLCVLFLFLMLKLGFFLPMENCQAQPNLLSTSENADTFAFSIRTVWEEDSKNGKVNYQYKDVSPKRQYDFEAQYPYYEINGKNWQVGEGLQINLHTLPDTGHVYLFSVDAMETVNVLFASAVDAKVLLPDSTHSFNIEFAGVERLCFWYSLSPIPQYERLAKGLEMTIGRFMERNAGQLGRSLLLPQNSWHLLEHQFGCRITDPKRLTASDIIPIVVELNIVAAPPPPPMSTSPKSVPKQKLQKK